MNTIATKDIYDFYTDTTPVIPPKTDNYFESPLW